MWACSGSRKPRAKASNDGEHRGLGVRSSCLRSATSGGWTCPVWSHHESHAWHSRCCEQLSLCPHRSLCALARFVAHVRRWLAGLLLHACRAPPGSRCAGSLRLLNWPGSAEQSHQSGAVVGDYLSRLSDCVILPMRAQSLLVKSRASPVCAQNVSLCPRAPLFFDALAAAQVAQDLVQYAVSALGTLGAMAWAGGPLQQRAQRLRGSVNAFIGRAPCPPKRRTMTSSSPTSSVCGRRTRSMSASTEQSHVRRSLFVRCMRACTRVWTPYLYAVSGIAARS